MGFDAQRLSAGHQAEILNGIVAAIPEHMRPDVAADLPATVAGMVEERNQLRDELVASAQLVAASQKAAGAAGSAGYQDALNELRAAQALAEAMFGKSRDRWVFLEGWVAGRLAGAE